MKRYLAVTSALALFALVAVLMDGPAPAAPNPDPAAGGPVSAAGLPSRASPVEAPAEGTAPAALEEPPAAQEPPAARAPRGEAPRVQVALVLDNSGSMSGLLDQARSELWTLVNAIAEAKANGKAPQLEVALYTYGDPPARRLLPFSKDLDTVSEALFSIGISGGSEHAGEAIALATEGLSWSDAAGDLKLLFVAGNEEFTQGPVPFAQAIARAKARGIVVSTIHCGAPGSSGPEWKQAAILAGGSHANIDHTVAVAHVASPFDEEIARLGVLLNETYLPYGAHGRAGALRQQKQDENAAGISAQIMSKRAVSKASGSYSNAGWDLVDALKDGRVDLARVDEGDLPEELRGLSLQERRAKVRALEEKRAELKSHIAALDAKRRAFVDAERKRAAGERALTLDRALLEGLRIQAQARGIVLASR